LLQKLLKKNRELLLVNGFVMGPTGSERSHSQLG